MSAEPKTNKELTNHSVVDRVPPLSGAPLPDCTLCGRELGEFHCLWLHLFHAVLRYTLEDWLWFYTSTGATFLALFHSPAAAQINETAEEKSPLTVILEQNTVWEPPTRVMSPGRYHKSTQLLAMVITETRISLGTSQDDHTHMIIPNTAYVYK